MSERMFRKSLDVMLVLAIYLLLCFPAVAEGFTVKSIDQVNDTFIIDVLANGGGNSLRGIINPSDFNIPDIKVNSTIEFEISNVEETLTYAPINMGVGALYFYNLVYYEATDDFWNGEAKCPPAPSYCFITVKDRPLGWKGPQQIVVVTKQKAGSYGVFQNPDRSTKAFAIVRVDGKEYRESIGTGEDAKTFINFKDVPVSVTSLGAVVTGKAVPTQYPYVATHPIGAQWWNVADRPSYDGIVNSMVKMDTQLDMWKEQEKKYNKFLDKTTKEELVCPDKLCSPLQRLVTVHNTQVENLFTKRVQIDYGSIVLKSEKVNYNGNIYHVLDRTIANNEYIISIKASALNIIVLSGIPKITDIVSPEFISGNGDAYAIVNFMNIGNATGTFAAVTSGSFESNKVTVPAGENGTIVLILKDGMNASEVNVNTVDIYDINSGSSDSKDFTMKSKQPMTDIANKTTVYNDVVLKTDITGMDETIEAECGNGIWQRVDGKFVCQDIQSAALIPNAQVPPQEPLVLKPLENSGFNYIWLVVVLLAFILVLIILNTVSGYLGLGRKSLKKGLPLILIIIGLGVLIIVAMLALYWGTVLEYGNEMMMDIIKRRIGI